MPRVNVYQCAGKVKMLDPDKKVHEMPCMDYGKKYIWMASDKPEGMIPFCAFHWAEKYEAEVVAEHGKWTAKVLADEKKKRLKELESKG